MNSDLGKPSSLCQKANKNTRKKSKRSRNLSGSEASPNPPEIAPHQIDPERQHEELSKSRIKLGTPLSKYLGKLDVESTEGGRAEEGVLRERENWEKTFNAVPDLICILDDKFRVVQINQAMADRLGLSPEKCIGQNCYKAVHKTESPPDNCPHLQTLKDGLSHTLEVYEENLGGYFIVSTSPMTDSSGKVVGSVHVARDITERKKAEESLRESEERYHSLVVATTNIVWTTNSRGELVGDQPSWCAFTGQSAGEINGWGWSNALHPEDRKHVVKAWSCAVKASSFYNTEYRIRRHDGEYRHFLVRGVPVLKNNGTVREWIGTCTDITEQKQAEEARAATERQLKASLCEKDILLKEVHHRVKNNLQFISSLLSLQCAQIKDKKAIEMLRESQDRIRALAMIHEKLYRSRSLANINISQCIRDLTSHLLTLYDRADNPVKVKVAVDDISFGIETAVPCGLVINELVSNALKYAFQGSRKGMNIIDIALRSYRGKYRLVVSDNGTGFPPGLNFRKTGSLGLQLVIALVRQMGGRISVKSEKGAKVSITFGEPKFKDFGLKT